MKQWKDQMKAAIEDYILNPCLTTGRGMLHVALARKAGAEKEAGVILAVAEECKRIGVPGCRGLIYLCYRFFLGFLGRLMTWRDSTWNDYHGLRWSFIQDPGAVEALHSRRHSRNLQVSEDATAALIKLFRDSEFRESFLLYASGRGCGKCVEAVTRYGQLTAESSTSGLLGLGHAQGLGQQGGGEAA